MDCYSLSATTIPAITNPEKLEVNSVECNGALLRRTRCGTIRHSAISSRHVGRELVLIRSEPYVHTPTWGNATHNKAQRSRRRKPYIL